jgi:phenylalanyl-tRNA synthetase alpha chain
MPTDLKDLEASASSELAAVSDGAALEAWRVAYLGRSGRLTSVLRSIASLPAEERRAFGAAANEAKVRLEAAYEERIEHLRQAQLRRVATEERLDVTLPGRPQPRGRLHPIMQTLREIEAAFGGMGFAVVEGPEVELDYYNFEALRMPPGHPARDMWDTLWVDSEATGGKQALLRTHTSPNQIRVMESHAPPVRAIVPGKVYRYEATDATHEWHFYQVEGFAVDRNISMADLKGTLAEFARRMFGAERKTRFRCDYFPFVEPGAEMSIDCFACDGKGCRVCKHSGWIEVLGAGMIHAEILDRVGYGSDEYTGFAFGMGVERITMLRHGIEDIRHFYQNDLRFLAQF